MFVDEANLKAQRRRLQRRGAARRTRAYDDELLRMAFSRWSSGDLRSAARFAAAAIVVDIIVRNGPDAHLAPASPRRDGR